MSQSYESFFLRKKPENKKSFVKQNEKKQKQIDNYPDKKKRK